MLPFSIARGLPSCLPSSPPVVNFQPIGANFRQKRAKVNDFLGVLGVFSGKSETKNGKNKKLFYFRGFRGAAFILFCGGGGRVHWCRLAGPFEGFRTCRSWLWSFGGAFPAFYPLSCFARGALLANMALFRNLRRFPEGFGVWMYVYMGWVLCVACVAFVRVNS